MRASAAVTAAFTESLLIYVIKRLHLAPLSSGTFVFNTATGISDNSHAVAARSPEFPGTSDISLVRFARLSGIDQKTLYPFAKGSRSIRRIRSCQEVWEDENEHLHTRACSPIDYLHRNPLPRPPVDSRANCGRGDWAAIRGAFGFGPNRTRGLILRPPEGSDPRNSRPLFSNSQPHLPIWRPSDRGGLSLYQPTGLSVGLRHSHSVTDLSSTPGKQSPRGKFR